MSEPLDKLEDAIREYFAADTETPDGTIITGWTIAASTTRLREDDGTIVNGARYAIGNDTSYVQAAGLAAYLDVVTRGIFTGDVRWYRKR